LSLNDNHCGFFFVPVFHFNGLGSNLLNGFHENVRNNGDTQEQVTEGKEICNSHQSAAQQGGAWNKDDAAASLLGPKFFNESLGLNFYGIVRIAELCIVECLERGLSI